MFQGQHVNFDERKLTDMWRSWSVKKDDGLKLGWNGEILGRILLDVIGRHQKAFPNEGLWYIGL